MTHRKNKGGLEQRDNQTMSAAASAAGEAQKKYDLHTLIGPPAVRRKRKANGLVAHDIQKPFAVGASAAGEGHLALDTQIEPALPAAGRSKRKRKEGEGHVDAADSRLAGAPPSPSTEGQMNRADQAAILPPSVDGTIIAQIRALHRKRCFAMEQRKRLDLALGAYIRTQLGWRLSLPEAERKAIADRAQEIIEDPEWTEFEDVVVASQATTAPWEGIEKDCVKRLTELAQSLPVWVVFGEDVRGFGPMSLATIVGEAGDLSIYSNPAKLWKRMGLAVMGEVRQGGLPKNASKEEWIEHGYNRQRRSRMWNIGDALIKGNKDGEYRAVYLARKEYEFARDPEMKPIKAHRRAQRYMEKRLLKNLWQAWRRAGVVVQSGVGVPAADTSGQTSQEPKPNDSVSGQRSANAVADTMQGAPSASISGAANAAKPKTNTPRKRATTVEPSPRGGTSRVPIGQTSGGQQSYDPTSGNGSAVLSLNSRTGVPSRRATTPTGTPKRRLSRARIERGA